MCGGRGRAGGGGAARMRQAADRREGVPKCLARRMAGAAPSPWCVHLCAVPCPTQLLDIHAVP